MAGGTLRIGLAATACVLAMTAPVAVANEPSPRAICHAPADLIRLAYPLTRTAHRLTAGEPLTIVAIGSSSTAGAGASSPDASYPSRLAAELRQRFPHNRIRVSCAMTRSLRRAHSFARASVNSRQLAPTSC